MSKKQNPAGGGKKRGFASRGAARGSRSANLPDGGGTRPHGAGISPNRRRGFGGGERPYDYAYYESEPATREYMARLFARHEFAVTDAQLERFWRYYRLLREYNASLDLTRIMGIEATVLKHFVDSAIILRWFEPAGPVLDIGSGPGFPGLPLAVMRGDLRFILAESRGKRVRFLETAVKELGLDNVSVFPRSVREDTPLGRDHGAPLGDVVTRALETVSPTLERILPLVERGARAAFMKGPGVDEEIAQASAAYAGVYELDADVSYDLPGTDQRRRLVVFRKIAP